MQILNLTGYLATEEQKDAGVLEVSEADRLKLRELLRFRTLPTGEEIQERVKAMANIAKTYSATDVMIAGPSFLMSQLEPELVLEGFRPMYSFSQYTSVGEDEIHLLHMGFIQNIV